MRDATDGLNVLILGGTNLMGPQVVRRLLARGHRVTLFHRGETPVELPDGVDHILGDRDDLPDFRDRFAALAPQVVLHAICYTEAQAEQAMDVFDGIAERLVVLSSCDVYRAFGRLLGTEGGPPEPTPLTEDSPLRVNHFPYGDAIREPQYEKIRVERVVRGRRSLPACVLRLPMVYGPRDHRHRLYAYLRRMADGRPAILLGETLAGWRACRGYVEDMAHAITLAVERPVDGILHVDSHAALSERAWVEAIARVYGWSGRVFVVPDGDVPPHLRFEGDATQDIDLDTARIRAGLGYAEVVDFDEGLRRTIAWELSHPPDDFDPTGPDYAAEDAVIARMTSGAPPGRGA